jgi:tagatose-1,6-bisphosphate aldolase
MFELRGSAGWTTGELRALKLVLTRVLAPAATALMLDAELGGLALETGAVPSTVALIMPLEAQGDESDGDRPATTLMADFSPALALRYGADACKLLLPYRADDPDPAARQEALVASTVAACHEQGLPLVIEPIVYRRSGESVEAHVAAHPQLVLRAVQRLQPLGGDLLKLPFPVPSLSSATEQAALEACRAVADACRDTPWVLLGAGVEVDVFVEQVRIAATAGASGFLAGRGIWGAVLEADPDQWELVATTICLPSLERCREVAEAFARPLGRVPVG